MVTEALAGTLEELRHAARAGARATRLVLVFADWRRPSLSRYERDFLWDAFHVPSFLLLCDEKGQTIAYECEAQDGFHVQQAGMALDGMEFVRTPCECGRAGTRIQTAESANLENIMVRS